MTATEELRRLLDERGVEWWEGDDERDTRWESRSLTWMYLESKNELCTGVGAVEMDVTPEQAVAATLGTGTCMADETDTIKCWVKCKDEPSVEHMELIHVMECSSCGGTYEHVNGDYEFCPRCGAKVVDE